jgi:hypothetical protein
MNILKTLSKLVTASAFVLVVLAGCDKKDDAITVAKEADKQSGIKVPGIEETRAIAEEGYIYGLPIVMN